MCFVYIEYVEGLLYSQVVGFVYVCDEVGEIVFDDNGFFQQGEFIYFGIGVVLMMVGFGSIFCYKNFSFNFLIDFCWGGKIYFVINVFVYLCGLYKEIFVGCEIGIGFIFVEEVEDYYGCVYSIIEQFVYDVDYIKFCQIQFIYNLLLSVIVNLLISGLNVGIGVCNVGFLYSVVDNIDLEFIYNVGNV